MEWKSPEYSKGQIINAGKFIKDTASSAEENKEALKVIDNWRASHAFPLQVIYCHLKRKYDKPNFIVAQRLKRLDSIVKKLEREPTMSLWTMQDLGGCRVVVPTIDDVYDAAKKYKSSRVRHVLKKEYDYIQQPKRSGYRSYHLVYQYQSDTKETYNRNMLIEIQIRTYLQHLWATAVETMGLFTKQALKASNGEEDALRFFALISSLFALKEDMPIVPETPEQPEDIISELQLLESKHNYLGMLSGIRVAVDRLDEKSSKRISYCILILNYTTRRLRMKFYKPSQIDEATKEYNQIESTRAENKIDAVLVSVSSFSTLKAAYPNYFSDIDDFVTTINEIINEK
ncbi:RelA/SpoT domain-containing protein [Desulfosporosinus sp.]|uniref:RelA/SpoT domain-containing protein n=1 Tax=Desulfosporosinus sp. TaxID=157907 RepID=UPI0025C1B4F9|nr:RelA/SpoT domain-containing protein [Desulfosporosinus sp.]